MMERLLKNNTVVKVLAFFLAVMLWVHVTGDTLRANIPEVTRPFRNVPLSWLNVNEGLQVMQIPGQIDVILNGRADLINEITPENIKAFVNLQGLGEGQHRISPVAEVPRGVRVISFDPQLIMVELEEVESPQKPVSLDLTGAPADGFVMGEPRILPHAVFVRGPRSLLAQVERVRAIINVDGANGDRVQMVPVQAVDADGREVRDVVVNPRMVEVQIPFSEPQKTVPVRVPLTGEPQAGYRIEQVTLTPPTVTLQGREEQLAEIAEIVTEPVSVEDASENITLDLAPVAPANDVTLLFDGSIRVEIIIIREQ